MTLTSSIDKKNLGPALFGIFKPFLGKGQHFFAFAKNHSPCGRVLTQMGYVNQNAVNTHIALGQAAIFGVTSWYVVGAGILHGLWRLHSLSFGGFSWPVRLRFLS